MTKNDINMLIAEHFGYTNISFICMRGHHNGYERRIPDYYEMLVKFQKGIEEGYKHQNSITKVENNMKPQIENGKITVYFTMVLHPAKGKWIRVGKAYSGRSNASEWLPIVRRSWRGCRAKVSSCTLTYKNGQLTQKSKEKLDKKIKWDT